jgi:serine/threonine-protein kinase
MDFGLAREVDSNTQTSVGGVEGTPAFMAPEQARGEKRQLDARTDVYGLGSTLYSALAGRPPFIGSATDVLVALLLDEPPPLRTFDPALPPALETIIVKCLEKEPARRYQTAQALAEDLGRYLAGGRIAARPPSLLRRLGRFAQRRKLLVASLTMVLLTSLILGSVVLRVRLQAAAQAELAKRLGQQIKDMEWLLRSSRQLQLHDLEREKSIVRLRMASLQAQLLDYGELSRSIAHYALGRGHLALHEYPQALVQLRQALALGYKDPELHYALGLVLGKHFEQAIYEARLSGGGDWAKKQLQELEPKFLQPAISSLRTSRAMKRDSPHYLDGLIAYYQRDYERALEQAQAAQKEEPWLYEAAKLEGDVHLERALQARDVGQDEQAQKEFGLAVGRYEAAAAEGRSDGEVYEGLAEAWVRQIEMAVRHGQPVEQAYHKAVAASDKVTAAEPQSIAGPLKKAFASLMTMSLLSSSLTSMERVQQCLAAANAVLAKQPENPYARDVAASCYLSEVEVARKQGQDPEPLLRKAVSLLESTTQQYPHFLWGINDLGNAYFTLGIHLQLHGSPAAREMIQKSLQTFAAGAALDPTYLAAPANALGALAVLVPEVQSLQELRGTLSQADDYLVRCTAINKQEANCYDNYFQSYARAANRLQLAGQDPQPSLHRALENLALARKLSNQLLDAEQHGALTHLVQAREQVEHKQEPTAALQQLEEDLKACFRMAAQDVVCRTLAAQGEWVRAQWQEQRNQSGQQSLQAALAKAELATQSPEPYPDAWQTLAQTHLRLARGAGPAQRGQHIAQGLEAVQKVFALNPNHALGLATQAELLLLRSQSERDPSTKQQLAQAARQALQRALAHDTLLSYAYESLLDSARVLSAAAQNTK